MRIDLGSLIKIEKEIFYIIEATYYKKENRLHLLIESEDPLLSNKEEDLREYFSDMDLSISYKKIEIEETHELENINEDLPENLGDNYDSFADDFEEEIDYMDIPHDEDLKPSKDDVPSDNLQDIDQGPEKVEDEPLNSNKEETSSQEEKLAAGEIPQKEENPNEKDSAEDLKKAKEAKLQRQIANAISIQNSAKKKIQKQKKFLLRQWKKIKKPMMI